jgi:hypothetical protein
VIAPFKYSVTLPSYSQVIATWYTAQYFNALSPSTTVV